MKSLVPWMCLVFAASASQQIFAENEFHAYRMGHYNKAADPLIDRSGKDPVADYYLGRMFLYGYGHSKNNELAIRYFTKSADKGYLPAIQLMAKYSLFKEKNPEQAVQWFKKAASADDTNAQMFVAAAYLFGVGVKPNPDVARKYYIDAAKNGNALAQFTLAKYFLDSKHSSNKKLGLIWLNKAVAAGNVQAVAKLGTLYIQGKQIPQDTDKGLGLLNTAAEQNYAPAMVELGEVAIANNDYSKAVIWFNKAIKLNEKAAYLHLAHAYLQEKSPIYDANAGFLWTLKAAQDGVTKAKIELAKLYQNGVGTAVNEDLAKQWTEQAKKDDKSKSISADAKAALWLSGNATDQLDQTRYQLNGIFGAWQNKAVLHDNGYNQAPKLAGITRQDLFKPQFELTQPNEVPIDSYYDALVDQSAKNHENQWTYPIYPLNGYIAAIVRANSMVLARDNLPAPYADANYYTNEEYYNNPQIMDVWTEGWQQQANFMSVFHQLYSKALLGDAESQFEIGQMFQYGLGVSQNDESAMIFYRNAAQQQHLGAEYNLGLLYLLHAKDKEDYQHALSWFTDSAFKGNRRSQYVLAKLLAQGKQDLDGVEVITPNHEQSQSMLYLAAANNYGPAEYELAENLAKEYDNGLNVDVKKHKLALIRQLYQGAANNGVVQAFLPLAFYNAMDHDQQKQKEAFVVAQEQAQTGNEHAALLLGLLYDRGIGTGSDPEKAIYWYQHAGKNPVSQFILGTYITEGKGMSVDVEKGMGLLNQAANARFSYADFNLAVLKRQAGQDFLPNLETAYNLGNSHAGIVLADYYLSQDNDADKMSQAKQIYSGLADKGDQYAQLKLAYMLENGLGTTPDVYAAQLLYTASANQGNPFAQFLLGQLYQLGETGAPDYNLALQWYQKAAKKLSQASVATGFIYETVDDNYTKAIKAYEEAAAKGNTIGAYNLALMYLYGKGVPVDYQKAKALFTEAANKGYPEAITQLAGIYFNGLGVPRDVHQGMELYKKAASLNNSNALYELGLLSETGIATKVNYADALKYYNDAASKGNERAMLALARMYHKGLGIDKDLKLSASYYQKLADRQNAYAQYKLGTFYMDGIAVERSIDKGTRLLKQASENGNMEARHALETLNTKSQAKTNKDPAAKAS